MNKEKQELPLPNKNIWYNKSRLLSYNTILNFLIGQRGGGKTYGFKTWAVDDFLKNGRQFLWLRRYDTELRGKGRDVSVLHTWVDDIEHLYPNVKFEIKASSIFINDKLAGFFGALSKSEQWKSISFNNVNKVIYDEFLIRTGVGKQYIKNEATVFLELMETVGRMREDVRFFLIGNALSFANPYFAYFKIKPFDNGFYVDRSRGITVQLYSNENFTDVKSKTRFGKLIKGTAYGDYAIENEFLLDNDNFIRERSPASKQFFNLRTGDRVYGVWIDYVETIMYISKTHDPNRLTYAFNNEDYQPGDYLVDKKNYDSYMRGMKKYYEASGLMFEDQMVKADMMIILSKI